MACQGVLDKNHNNTDENTDVKQDGKEDERKNLNLKHHQCCNLAHSPDFNKCCTAFNKWFLLLKVLCDTLRMHTSEHNNY